VKGRHGSRGWPARGTEAGVDRRRRRVRAARGGKERGGEGEADKRARRGIFIFFSFFPLGCDKKPMIIGV